MIKINLLPQRKPKRQAEPGQKDVALGMLVLIVLGAGIFFGLHRPKQAELAKIKSANEATDKRISDKKKKTDGPPSLADLRTQVTKATEQTKAIEKLTAARAVPGHMLHELGEILMPGHLPTMRDDIRKLVLDPKNETYRVDTSWNSQHVWITSFSEKQGVFTMTGGAESDADVTQLSKRMQASVYFQEVNPRGGERITDKDSGITYYAFTISGRVVY